MSSLGPTLTVITPGRPIPPVPVCCAPAAVAKPEVPSTTQGTTFHFALNVTDLQRSLAFYRVLFGVEPAKQHAEYAKFEVVQPPLVFSLVPNPPVSAGSLSHFGLPVNSTAEVQSAAERLAAAGLEITSQEGTVCGYARQDKVWVSDPDRNFWEIYVVHEDVDHESVRSAFDGIALPVTPLPASSESANLVNLWEHRVLMAVPQRIPHDNGSVEEVRLEGTFNDKLTDTERAAFLKETLRVLRPGGKISVHGLVADGPLQQMPALPGVAALVHRVPQESELPSELIAAGFESVLITKLPEMSVFQHGNVGMREIKLEASKPLPSMTQLNRMVLYKGPFAKAVDHEVTFERGQRTPVSQQAWDRLASGPAASQFVFMSELCADACGCG